MIPSLRTIFVKVLRFVYTDKDDNYRHWAIGISMALATSALIYQQAVDAYNPSLNILRLAWYETPLGDPHKEYKGWIEAEQNPESLWEGAPKEMLKKYVFYAGSKGGFYDKIGRHLKKEWEPTTGPNALTVVNIGGSSKIARAVYSNDRALGIVQEEMLFEQDLLDGQVQIISPLYDERVHVLYRKSALERACGDSLAGRDCAPRLGRNSSQAVRDFFAASRVRERSKPSGNLPLAHYLMHYSGVAPGTIVNMGISASLDSLDGENPSLDIAFIVAGAPLAGINDLLKRNHDIGLMSLEPDLISAINPTLNMALRPSVFSDHYSAANPSLQGVTTLASRAMLIAARDVPSWVIREIGEKVSEMRSDSQAKAPQVAAGGTTPGEVQIATADNPRYLFPVSEYPFQVRIRKEYASLERQMLRILLIALVTIGLLSRLFHNILIWTISNYKHARYSRTITQVYEDLLPRNSKLGRVFDDQPTPIVDPNHEGIVNDLVEGISLLLKQTEAIRHDFTTGGIMVGHQADLIDNVYGIKAIFQRQLGQRLNEAVLSGRAVPMGRVRKLFTAGYIDRDAFEALAMEPETPTPPMDEAEAVRRKAIDRRAAAAEG